MKKQKHSIHPIFTHPFLYACMVTLLAGCPMPFQGLGITGKAPTSSSTNHSPNHNTNHSANQAKKLKPTTFPGAKIGTKQAVPSRDKQRGGAEAVRSQEVAGLGADGLKKHTAEFAALLNDRLEDQETEFTRLLAKLSESRATAGKNQETLPTEETNQIQITGGPENANPKSDENEEAIANNAAEIAEQQAKIAEQQAKIAEQQAEIAADELNKLSPGMVLLLWINNQYAVAKAAAEAVETARKAVEEAVAKAKSALQTAEEARTRLEAITKATNAAKAKAAEAVERARKSVEKAENALTKASASSSTTKAAIEELRKCYYGKMFPSYGRTFAVRPTSLTKISKECQQKDQVNSLEDVD